MMRRNEMPPTILLINKTKDDVDTIGGIINGSIKPISKPTAIGLSARKLQCFESRSSSRFEKIVAIVSTVTTS